MSSASTTYADYKFPYKFILSVCIRWIMHPTIGNLFSEFPLNICILVLSPNKILKQKEAKKKKKKELKF